MIVQDLLDRHKGGLVACRPEDTIKTAAILLRSNHIGAMPVCDDGNRLLGVLSERDIVRGVADRDAEVLLLPVGDLMTTKVVVCRPADSVVDAMRLMFQNKIRHLPVIEEGTVCGMISLRAVMESRLRTRKWTGAGVRAKA